MQHQILNPPIRTVCTTPFGAASDRPVFVVETYYNSTTKGWYRKYSDGVIEQGGYESGLARNTETTYNLVAPLATADILTFNATVEHNGTTSYSNIHGSLALSSITTTQFTVHYDTYDTGITGFYWEVRGKWSA